MPRSALSKRHLSVEMLEHRHMLATFVVTTVANSGDGSLRDAISLANDNDEADPITFDDSLSGQTIDLTTGRLEIGNPLTIDARSLTDPIRIDASRFFKVITVPDSSAEYDVTLAGLTIANGQGGLTGGGVSYSGRGELQLIETTVEGNSGAAIATNSGRITLRNCIVRNNTGDRKGGGICGR